MKKIALWKIILLSIITVGVYPIVWFVKRRDELVNNYKLDVPHGLWLVLPIAIATIIALTVIPIVSIAAAFNSDYNYLLTIAYIVLFIIPFCITIWWVARFSMGINNVVGGRIPTVWTVLIYVFWGLTLPVVQQFYINRFASKKLPSKTTRPSTRLIVYTCVAIFASIILNGCIFIAPSGL